MTGPPVERAVKIQVIEEVLEAAREHAKRARSEGFDEETCRFWSGTCGFLRSRIRALQAGMEPDWPDAMRYDAAGAP